MPTAPAAATAPKQTPPAILVMLGGVGAYSGPSSMHHDVVNGFNRVFLSRDPRMLQDYTIDPSRPLVSSPVSLVEDAGLYQHRGGQAVDDLNADPGEHGTPPHMTRVASGAFD